MKRRANGEGTVYQRKDGRWQGQVVLGDGRRKSVYAETQRDAIAKLRDVAHAKQQGLPVVDERQTLGSYLASWLETSRPRLRPATARRYEQLVRIHVTPEFARIALAKLEPDHLERLYAARLATGAAARSVRHLHSVLHNALRQAHRWGKVSRNVADLARPPRAARREMRILTEEQVGVLLAAAAGDRLEALYVLAVTSGMRQGELLALRWSDVDLEQGMARVTRSLARGDDGWTFLAPKTPKSRRRIELAKGAVLALRAHRTRQLQERLALAGGWEDLGLVFPNELGRPIEPNNLSHRSWRRLLERADVPRVRFHDLRHTAISIPLAHGVNAKKVSEMAGHSSVAFTLDTYGHVMPSMHREVADVFDRVLEAQR